MAVEIGNSHRGTPREWPATLDVDELIARGWRPTPFRQFLLKVHSRCNLSCDYCYVYTLADQSWRRKPLTMAPSVLALTAQRIAEHARAHDLDTVRVILHGGEPLLAGRSYLAGAVSLLRQTIGPVAQVHMGLQTNGALLDEGFLRMFKSLNVRVGVSLDGDQAAHDRHRRSAGGHGSHAAVSEALRLLMRPEHREVYSGLLCTIDLRNEPITVYEAMLAFAPPAMDFLLPHGTWSAPPPGRGRDPAHTPYAEWLITIFDRWYGSPKRETRVRLFEEIVHLLLGGVSRSEAIGLAPTTLVVVETDGSIEQADTLKSAYDGAPMTGLHVARDPFDAALRLPSIAARQLGLDALADDCMACSLRRVCGGGLYPHRYQVGSGFRNPSVYCPDLFRLISHIRNRVVADLRARPGGNWPLIRRYVVPDDVFSALAAGGGGACAMRLLARAQRGKHLLLLRMVVATASRISHPRAAELASAYEVLSRAQANRPSDVEPLLRHPPVSAWAIRAVRDLGSGAALDHGYLAALAASAALLAGMDCAVEVPLDGDHLFLPFLGRAQLRVTDPPETATVRSWPEGGEILAAGARRAIPTNPWLDGDGWQGIRRLTAGTAGQTTSLLLDDLDPYRFPGGQTAGRLDTVGARQWQRALDDAWALLVAHHPQTAEEIATGVTVLVPLRALPGHEVSATSRHAFGTIGLSRPSGGRAFAVALAHERQHAKLNALLDLVRLIDDPGLTRWYAPWRDDPRPLGALLQGAYAHVGVTAFWRQQRHLDRGETALRAHAEFARWRDETRKVVSTLQASGALTRCGTRFVDGMATTLDAWAGEPVPTAAAQRARTAITKHQAAWRLRHGHISEKAKLSRE